MMKKIWITSLFLALMCGIASADTFVRAGGTFMPEQEVSITPPGGGGDINFDLNSAYGGQAEVGVYSPMGLLSFGLLGTFENLRGFNPAPGIESVDAQVYSLMGNMCANVQNKSSLTPYACGGVGLFWIDPGLTIPGGIKVSLDSETASGYAVEAGLRYKTANAFSVFGGVNWRDTFDEPVIGIGGAPGIGTGVGVDLGRYGFVAGIEF
jgi:hypothetical protein